MRFIFQNRDLVWKKAFFYFWFCFLCHKLEEWRLSLSDHMRRGQSQQAPYCPPHPPGVWTSVGLTVCSHLGRDMDMPRSDVIDWELLHSPQARS